MKTNEQYLRELIADSDEAIEFLDALIEEHDSKVDSLTVQLENINDEVADLKNEIEDEPEFEVADLGLDKLYYYLERGNLHIQQQLESFIRSANTIPNAEPMFT